MPKLIFRVMSIMRVEVLACEYDADNGKGLYSFLILSSVWRSIDIQHTSVTETDLTHYYTTLIIFLNTV
jgi:hypothetical protein